MMEQSSTIWGFHGVSINEGYPKTVGRFEMDDFGVPLGNPIGPSWILTALRNDDPFLLGCLHPSGIIQVAMIQRFNK